MSDQPWHRYSRAERERFPLRPGFKRNTGQAPRGKSEKTVIVALMDGQLANTPWPVKTTRWSLTGWWHDVDQWKLTD